MQPTHKYADCPYRTYVNGKPVSVEHCDRCTHEHGDPIYAYGYPCSVITYADGHAHRVINSGADCDEHEHIDTRTAIAHVYGYKHPNTNSSANAFTDHNADPV